MLPRWRHTLRTALCGAAMNFDVFGPFEIPRNEALTLIDSERLDELIYRVEIANSELPDACGCYVFAIRAAKGYRPWYVGKTKKNALIKEAFYDDKVNKYNIAINK